MNLLTRLSVVQRIVALGVLASVLVVGLMATQVRQQLVERNKAEQEQRGLPMVSAVLTTARLTAEHRGMSNTFLGGNAALADKLSAKRAEVDQSLAQVAEKIGQATHSDKAGALVEALRTEWKAVAEGVSSKAFAARDSFGRHSALIEQQLALVEELLSSESLLLDDDPVSHALIEAALVQQPWLSETLGRVRGFGAGMLGKPSFDSQDQAYVASTLDTAKRSAISARAALQRAAALNPELKSALAAPLEKAEPAFREGVSLVDSQLLQAALPNSRGADFFAAMTQVIAAQQEVSKVSFAVLEARTQAAASRALRHVQFVIGLSASALALMLGLIVSLARSVRRSAREAVQTSQALADGDFRAQATVASHDEFGAIAQALDQARVDISHAVQDVRVGVDSLAEATREIQQGSHDLSQRTEQQASTLEETASAMEHLKGLVTRSSQDAVSAGQRAAEVSHHAERGGEVMTQVVKTMTEISESSKQIGGIVALIDSIAFQTNILALNAAVEAARAGEQGRGFAVVASEVRTHAQRSGEAARENRRMIEQSGERIDAGNQFVVSAGKSMELIVAEVRGVNELLQRIGENAREHADGIGQVSDAVSQLDQVTQANAALAEQSAAAAESLRDQAERLAESVARFKLAQ